MLQRKFIYFKCSLQIQNLLQSINREIIIVVIAIVKITIAAIIHFLIINYKVKYNQLDKRYSSSECAKKHARAHSVHLYENE